MALRLLGKSVVFSLLCLIVCPALKAQAANNPIGCAVPKKPVHVYYADPINGSMNGDGSRARPWGALADVIAAHLINGQDNTTGVVHAGDLIYLLSGNHGNIYLNQYFGKFVNTDFITIQAAPGQSPYLTELAVDTCSHWVFRGLTLKCPDKVPQYYILARFLTCDNILFDGNTIYSQSNVSKWSPTDWQNSSAQNGVNFTGVSSTLINNTVKNVQNGIYIGGDGIVLQNNTIDCFSCDGIDFSCGNSIIQYNRVTNHYGLYNTGHGDLIQGWHVTNPTSNVLIDSNYVMASTGTDPSIPAVPTCVGSDTIQGISIFDGVWDHVTVTNNVVGAAAYHGIALYGTSDLVIANNTVVVQGADRSLTAWIGVFEVSGQPVSNALVRNNIANQFVTNVPSAVMDHNISFTSNSVWTKDPTNTVVLDPSTVFVQYQPATATYNFNLKAGSPAIGAGTSSSAPALDILKRSRNPLKIDDGAYSYVGK